MTAVVDGPANVEYDVFTEAPEEDEYIVARAIADFVPEEEGLFIALETNAPVFVFTKHVSGWWTGECKGKYGLFPSNFVSEEFHVTLQPKAFDAALALEVENREAVPSAAGNDDSSLEDSDDDTDDSETDDDDEEEDPNDDLLNSSSGSMPIAIPSSAHATPEKHSLPKLTLPSADSFLLTDTSKLTPVSRQLGEFVDRLNESARTPPVSNPTTPTSQLLAGTSPRYSTPTSARRKSGTVRVARTDSLGIPEDMVFDREKNKLTPVSKQLGEFVDRLNKGRTSVDLEKAALYRTKSSRNGEPIFNVFDGLLADIESLRNNPVDGEEWDDEDVYNTPEAARARIATDVKALRDELEQANNARISMESDIVRLREEYTAKLEMERKGRIILEKRLSERAMLSVVRFIWRELSPYPRETSAPLISLTPVAENPPPTETVQKHAQQELEEYKEKNNALEAELAKLQQIISTMHKQSEDSLKAAEEKRTTQAGEAERMQSEEVKILRAELESLRAQKAASEKNTEEQIRAAKEQIAREKDEFFIKEREHLVQQNNELMQVELRKLSEREEERTRIALEDRSKQLDAVIAAHEETCKRLELERDQARASEAAKAKELQELKGKYQKQKNLPPMPKAADPKVSQPKTPETKSPETKAPETKALETKAPETKAPETKAPETKASESKAPEIKAPEVSDAKASEPKAAPTLKIAGPKAADLKQMPPLRTNADQPKQPTTAPPSQTDQPKHPVTSVTPRDSTTTTPRSTTPPKDTTTPRDVALKDTTTPRDTTTHDSSKDSLLSPRDATSKPAPTMQRALSHEAVPGSNRPALRPPTQPTTTDTQHIEGGVRKIAHAAPIRRTIANRPEEDNSLATNPLFQQKRLSTQVLEPIPTTFTAPTSTPAATTATATTQSQAPVLRRAASSLPSVPSG